MNAGARTSAATCTNTTVSPSGVAARLPVESTNASGTSNCADCARTALLMPIMAAAATMRPTGFMLCSMHRIGTGVDSGGHHCGPGTRLERLVRIARARIDSAAAFPKRLFLQSAQTIGDDRATETLQRQRLLRVDVDKRFDAGKHALRDQDLAAGGFAAKPGGEVGHRTDGAVVPAALESDSADRRISLRYTDAEAQLVAALGPVLRHAADAFAHRKRHPHCALGGVRNGQRIVEEDRHAVAGEVLERSLVLEHDVAGHAVILAEHAHHVLGLGDLGKRGEAAQIEEHHGDFAAMTLQRVVSAAVDDEFGELWRKEPPQASYALELADLFGDAPFERGVPLLDFGGKRLHGVVQPLDAKHRAHPCHQ